MSKRGEYYKVYTVEDLLSLENDPNRWIVPDMIPRIGRVLIYGKGSVYKSSFIFDLAISVASGGKLLEQLSVVRVFGPVLLLSTEGSIYSNRDRLIGYMRSRNVHPSTVRLYYGQQPLELRNAHDVGVLEQMIKQTRPAMVVLDPLVSFYGGNENDSEQMSSFANKLNDLIEEYEFALVIIHHANKAADLRGSTVLQAWADSIIRFDLSRNVEIPSFPERKDVITASSEKQRDGRVGTLFSAVPFFDEELKMITFGVYDSLDAKGVVLTYLRNQILRLLRRARANMTIHQLTLAFHVGHQRVEDAMRWLVDNGLVDVVSDQRPTGGGRTRQINAAYRASALGTRVDAAHAILQASKKDSEDGAGHVDGGESS